MADNPPLPADQQLIDATPYGSGPDASVSGTTGQAAVTHHVAAVGGLVLINPVGTGHSAALAERVFRQIEGFGSYGFPESHAAGFAHLAYASAWVKCHHPTVFAAGQIVRDAQARGTRVRPADVNASEWDCTLEPDAQSAEEHALLGLRLAAGLAAEGRVERETERAEVPITHLICRRLADRPDLLNGVDAVRGRAERAETQSVCGWGRRGAAAWRRGAAARAGFGPAEEDAGKPRFPMTIRRGPFICAMLTPRCRSSPNRRKDPPCQRPRRRPL